MCHIDPDKFLRHSDLIEYTQSEQLPMHQAREALFSWDFDHLK